jgi:hypothetical protein
MSENGKMTKHSVDLQTDRHLTKDDGLLMKASGAKQGVMKWERERAREREREKVREREQ